MASEPTPLFEIDEVRDHGRKRYILARPANDVPWSLHVGMALGGVRIDPWLESLPEAGGRQAFVVHPDARIDRLKPGQRVRLAPVREPPDEFFGRSGNPTLNAETFDRFATQEVGDDRMTLAGTVNKCLVLLGVLLIAAWWPWTLYFATGDAVALAPYLWTGALGGLGVALVTVFRPTWSPALAPVYAALEGLALGAVSAVLERRFPGIVLQAVALTFGTLLTLLMAYKSRFIKPTENFRLGVVSATGAIALVYVISLGSHMLGAEVPFVHEGGVIGIGFSGFVVVMAALNLVLDFDFIEHGAEDGAPKYMEWYAAFGLMVTLVWLYLEILRLLAKLQEND